LLAQPAHEASAVRRIVLLSTDQLLKDLEERRAGARPHRPGESI